METCEKFLEEIEVLMRAKGVSTFLFWFNDPDSNKYGYTGAGDTLTRLGAIVRLKRAVEDEIEGKD